MKEKYGLFVHYIGSCASRRSGEVCTDLNEIAGSLDAAAFAAEVAEMGAEYVIFTAWHSQTKPLFPSRVSERYRPGSAAKRDLIRDLLEELSARNIRLILYTHPRDGFEFSEEDKRATGWGKSKDYNPDPADFNRELWNRYIYELYMETARRYQDKLYGFWIDEGSPEGDSYRLIDYPRLLAGIKSIRPDYVTIHNFYGTTYGCDQGMKEYGPDWGEFRDRTGESWPVYEKCVGAVVSANWSAVLPETQDAIRYAPEAMYRYAVLQIAANREGGGIAWAAGPYMDGGWEKGVLETLREVWRLLSPVRRTLLGTEPSASYPMVSGSSFASAPWGAAVSSADGTAEYLHILKPPKSALFRLPPPADGKRFVRAVNYRTGAQLPFSQTEDGVTVKIDAFDPLDTVLVLTADGAARPHKTTVYFNDTAPEIAYHGDWTYSRWERNCGDFEGDMHIASLDESWAQLCFEGVQAAVIGNRSPSQGRFDVYLDGVFYGRIDAAEEEYLPQRVLFETPVLAAGKHTIRVVKAGGPHLELDAFRVVCGAPEPKE